MSFYLCTDVTDNEINFTKSKMYCTTEDYGITTIRDDDNTNIYSYPANEFVNQMKNCGVHLALAATNPDLKYIEVHAGLGKLESGKIYEVLLQNYDESSDEPLKDVFVGVEVKLDEIGITKEQLTLALRDNFEIYDLAGTLNFYTGLGVNVSSYDRFYNQNFMTESFDIKEFEPYVATAEEEQKLIYEMGELLDEYGYTWTNGALQKIVRTFFERKGHLLSMFMAHPNYQGNYQIVYSDETYRLDTNRNAGYEFVNWINGVFNSNKLLKHKTILGHTYDELETVKAYHQATMPVVKPILVSQELFLMNYELMDKKRREIDKIDYIMQMFRGEKYTDESILEQKNFYLLMDFIKDMKADRMDEESAKRVNNILPELRARKDQKTTKIVGKIMAHFGIDKIEKYHKNFAKYCDDINIIRIKRHTVLSLHPLDYLTMSFGNSWSSCHTIDKNNRRQRPGDGYHGMYSSGTMSYMLDTTSFVLYTVNCDYEGKTFWEQDKINRCMFHLGKERMVQGRCYPQAEDSNADLYKQFRALVHRTIAEIWNVPNLWILKKSGFKNEISHQGTNYADYFNYSLCNMTTYKFAKDKKEIVPIGATPLCVSCGQLHKNAGSIACCTDAYEEEDVCYECGYETSTDDMHYIDGHWYCDDCCFWCAYHEQYEVGEEYCYVEGYGDICESAYDYGDFFWCEDCNRYYHGDDGRDVADYERVCVNCFENDYVYVDSENEYHHRDDVIICDYCDHTVLRNSVTHVEDHGDICEDCLDEYFHEDDDGNYIHNEAEAV